MKYDGITEDKINDIEIDAQDFRNQILSIAKQFKTNWLEFAKNLYKVKKEKLFREWGYMDFDNYCSKELVIKKQTAFKLLNSYYFLTHEEPRMLEEEIIKKDDANLPPLDSIDILRRARANKNINEGDYDNLKEAVLEKTLEPKEVGKQFRSMLWAAKSADPDEERRKKRIGTIKRILGTLKNLKKEAELLKILPPKLIDNTEKIISELEIHVEEIEQAGQQ